MAAGAALPDQKLEDRIHQLHKLPVDLGLRPILEEAMQLCGVGRHLEAAALVEKAEAMSSLVSHQGAGPKEVPPGPKREDPRQTRAADQPLAARLAADIANGLTNVLVRAIQDLERHLTGENSRLSSLFGDRLDKLQRSVESLQPLHERLDHLVQAGIAAQERFEQLTATTASLREAYAHLDSDIGVLKRQVDQVSASTSSRVDEACRRIEGQEREISAINSGMSELASKIAAAAERLARHAHAIRTIHDSHQERTEVLGQVSQLLDRLRNAPVSTEAITL